MSFVYQESSFKADARPEREKILGFIPWFRPSSAVGYSQALKKHGKIIKMKLAIVEQIGKILMIQQILLVGMPAKDIIRVLKKQMLDLYILPIMKGIEALKRKPIEKNNG